MVVVLLRYDVHHSDSHVKSKYGAVQCLLHHQKEIDRERRSKNSKSSLVASSPLLPFIGINITPNFLKGLGILSDALLR